MSKHNKDTHKDGKKTPDKSHDKKKLPNVKRTQDGTIEENREEAAP